VLVAEAAHRKRASLAAPCSAKLEKLLKAALPVRGCPKLYLFACARRGVAVEEWGRGWRVVRQQPRIFNHDKNMFRRMRVVR